MGVLVRRGGLVSRLARRGGASCTGRCGRGPFIPVAVVVLLLWAFASPASAVTVTLTVSSGSYLGDNVTVSGSATECTNGNLSCSGFIVAVDGNATGNVINKSLTKGATFSVPIPTAGSTVVSPDCSNALNKGVYCITLPGTYKVRAWVVNATIPDDVNQTYDNLSTKTRRVGDAINGIPPDATATFVVGSQSFTSKLSATSIIAGDAVKLTGSAKTVQTVGAWVFDSKGTLANGRCNYRGITPDGDGTFTWTLDRTVTATPGTYTILAIFPGGNGIFEKTGSVVPPFATSGGDCTPLGQIDGSQILATLKGQVDALRTDDAYRAYTLQVSGPFLKLDPLTVLYLNDSFTVSGRSNRPGGTAFVTVSSTVFQEQKSASISDSGVFSVSFQANLSSNDSLHPPWMPGSYTVSAVDDSGNQDQMVVQFVEKRPAAFKVDNLVVYFEDGAAMDGRAPSVGQKLTAAAVLINKGEDSGTTTLNFQLSGRNLCSADKALGPGQFALVNCTFVVNYTGTYTLQVGEKSAVLRVGGPSLPEVTGEVKPVSSLPAGGQARLLFSGAVDQVVLQARSPVSGVQVVVQPLDQRPADAPAPAGVPFRYFRLSGVNLPDSAVGSLTVVFRVDSGWLAEKKLDPGTVRIYRLTAASTAAGAAAKAGPLGWRVEPSITRLGAEGRTDGSSDVVYQAQVSAFGDFAVVGGSTEGAISAAGQGNPLAILFNIPVMAAIAGGAGFAVFAWRKGWLDRLLKRKKGAAEPGAPGAALAEGAAEALPRTYEDEVFSLFRSGQLAQAFRRIFDEVSVPLKATLGLEGTFSSGELLREAEGKGLDPTLLSSLGQLFATCDAARFSGIPPTEEHLKWALRAARSVFVRLSGGAALPATTGGGQPGAMPPPEAGFPDPSAGTMGPPGLEPQAPPAGPEGEFEAADIPPDADVPPAPENPEEHKNGNGNGSGNRRRRRRRGGGGNGNGNGNGNGHHGNGNGNGNGNGGTYQAAGRLLPAGAPYSGPRGTYYGPVGGGRYSAAPPPVLGGTVVDRVRVPPPAGAALTAYSNFQKGLVPGPAVTDPPPPMPIPPLSPRPASPAGPNGAHGNGHNGNGHGTSGHGTSGTNGHGLNGNGHGTSGNGHNGTNGHGTNGTNGHGTNGTNGNGHSTNGTNGHPTNGTNGHGLNGDGHGTNGTNGHGTNGHGTNGHAAPPAKRKEPKAAAPRPSLPPPIALDRATMAAMMAAEYRSRRRGVGMTGIGGRTPTPSGPARETSRPPDGSGGSDSAGPSNPPPSLSSPPTQEGRRERKSEPAPHPREVGE